MTTATKGADLDRRMYALGPTALADEAASLLWDDGRRSLYAGDAAGCDAAAAPGLTPLQREVLGAATLLRRLCDEGPEWRVAACEALAAAPAAVDTALALLAAPPRFGTGAPAGACAARHVRPRDAAAGAAAVMRRGPAGLLASVAAATHPVLATVAGSRWWPRAAAALARLARGEGHGDDALRDVAADALGRMTPAERALLGLVRQVEWQYEQAVRFAQISAASSVAPGSSRLGGGAAVQATLAEKDAAHRQQRLALEASSANQLRGALYGAGSAMLTTATNRNLLGRLTQSFRV